MLLYVLQQVVVFHLHYLFLSLSFSLFNSNTLVSFISISWIYASKNDALLFVTAERKEKIRKIRRKEKFTHRKKNLLFLSPLISFRSRSKRFVALSLTSAPSFKLRAEGCNPGKVVILLSPTVWSSSNLTRSASSLLQWRST